MLDSKTVLAAMKMGRDAFGAGKPKHGARSVEFDALMAACDDSDLDRANLRRAWERGYDNAAAAERRGSPGATGRQSRYAAALKKNGWV